VSPEELALLRVIRLLDEIGIPYMVTGSVASSHHGRPRATHDADVVIDPSPEALDRLVRELAGLGFYVDAGRARDALVRRRQFNVIDTESAWKIDLIIRKDRAFSREEFGRRREAEISDGIRAMLASPEDSVLSKLEWAKKGGGSERQLADVAGVVEVERHLDRGYIARWARELEVLDLWERLIGGRTPEG
jgi:hypothetical protein